MGKFEDQDENPRRTYPIVDVPLVKCHLSSSTCTYTYRTYTTFFEGV
jgi:hypothetical protein